MKRKFADEENHRAGKTSASIPPPSDGQTILSPSADVAAKNPKPILVHSESETKLPWFDSPPDIWTPSEASTDVEDETSFAGFRCLGHRWFSKVPEESIPVEPEASIPVEPEASNSKDTIKDDVESTLVVSDDTGVAVPVAMEAGAEVPTRRFKKKRRKLTAIVKAEASMPTKIVEAEASIPTKRSRSMAETVEAEASIPKNKRRKTTAIVKKKTCCSTHDNNCESIVCWPTHP